MIFLKLAKMLYIEIPFLAKKGLFVRLIKLTCSCCSGDFGCGIGNGTAYLATQGGDRSDWNHDDKCHHKCIFNCGGPVFIMKELKCFIANRVHLNLFSQGAISTWYWSRLNKIPHFDSFWKTLCIQLLKIN